MPNAIYGIKFHKCANSKHYATWTRLLKRDKFRVNSNTVVCSNHFQYGQPFRTSPHPSLYLTGYNTPTPQRRRVVSRHEPPPAPPDSPPKQPHRTTNSKFKDCAIQVDPEDLMLSSQSNHDYVKICNCDKTTCFICSSKKIQDLEMQLRRLEEECEGIRKQSGQATEETDKVTDEKRFSIFDICNSDHLIKLYTGIPSYELFLWLIQQIRPHCENMQYYHGKDSATDKMYQIRNTSKPGPKRTLTLEDELLLTLMKLRLNLLEEDLAFRFRISQSTVSQILSTWIPLLARELESFIYWPTQEEIKSYYPQCFKKYKGCVRSIIDCTEIPIDRPSLAASNNEVYSQYKSRPTIKCLIGITPGGTISYVSKPVGGSKSDKQIVKMTNLVDKFDQGDVCMADRGFNIQELLLNKQVALVIPPFKRTTASTSQFTEDEDAATKTVANARIHVERAIGRIKEFQLMQGPIHLTMIDLMEASLIVCAALVNLQPALVPLTS